MVSAQSCVLLGKRPFFFALKHRKHVVFNNIGRKFIRYACSSFRIKFWLLKKFGFKVSSALISIVSIGRVPQLCTWFILKLDHFRIAFVLSRVCKANASLALSWVSLRHQTAEANFADGALSNFYVSSTQFAFDGSWCLYFCSTCVLVCRFVHLHVACV